MDINKNFAFEVDDFDSNDLSDYSFDFDEESLDSDYSNSYSFNFDEDSFDNIKSFDLYSTKSHKDNDYDNNEINILDYKYYRNFVLNYNKVIKEYKDILKEI